MSDIEQARRRLRMVAHRLRALRHPELAMEVRSIIYGLMYRRPAARRMGVRSRRITPAIRAQIIELADTTDMHSSEIAAEVGVNPGRVSEILHGDR